MGNPTNYRHDGNGPRTAGEDSYGADCDVSVESPEGARLAQVRKMPSWPRSWATFSLLRLYSYWNA